MSSNASRSLNGLKILVVDDSKTIRRTAETLLTKEGCQVFTAIDGFDALSKIADHQPDLIFVDIMMPRLDGYETCSLIKHNKMFKKTPVIMLSSRDGLFDRARGRIVGSEQYLTKEGCQVFTAIDGFDALSKIADHQPDLIFVDIMMPRLDGYETCSLIKHNKMFKKTPVIMLSSRDGLFDRARGRIVGSEQYLTKPFTKDELLGAITNQIG